MQKKILPITLEARFTINDGPPCELRTKWANFTESRDSVCFSGALSPNFFCFSLCVAFSLLLICEVELLAGDKEGCLHITTVFGKGHLRTIMLCSWCTSLVVRGTGAKVQNRQSKFYCFLRLENPSCRVFYVCTMQRVSSLDHTINLCVCRAN